MAVIIKAYLAEVPWSGAVDRSAPALVHEQHSMPTFQVLPPEAVNQTDGKTVWFEAEPRGTGYQIIRRVEDQGW